MITKEILKAEIDKIQDQYLEAVYRIIKAFEHIPSPKQDIAPHALNKNEEWQSFVEKTYGCLADDPIERGNQGKIEIREEID